MTKRTNRVRKKRTEREQRSGSGHKFGHSASDLIQVPFLPPNFTAPVARATVNGQEARERKHEFIKAMNNGHSVRYHDFDWFITRYEAEVRPLSLGGYWEWWSFSLERAI